MSVFKNKIIAYFKSKKINVLLLFVLFALLISLLTKLSKEYTVTLEFNINPINLPEEYVILQDSVQVMNVTVTSFGFNLLPYYLRKESIDLDFSNIENDRSTYLWTKDQGLSSIVDHFDNNIKIEAINPESFEINFDINAIKNIPVLLQNNVMFAAGYDILNTFNISPDSIKVIGPEKVLDSINSIKTEQLTLNNVKSDISTDLKLLVSDEFKNLSLSSRSVSVNANVVKFTEGAIEVPVKIKNVPNNVALNYYPKYVSVFYFASLDAVKSISEDSFIVECDYNNVNDKDSFLIPKISSQPESVKNVRLDTNRIEFILTQ